MANQYDYAAKIGRSHRSTRQVIVSVLLFTVFFVTAGNGGINVSAVRGDFGFKFERGRRTPTREVGHKRTCKIGRVYRHSTRSLFGEFFAVVFGYRYGGNVRRLTHRHRNIAFDVIVNNAGNRPVTFGKTRFFFEGVVAAPYEYDFTFNRNTAVFEVFEVNVFTRTRNGNVFERRAVTLYGFSVAVFKVFLYAERAAVDEFLIEIVFFGGNRGGFFIEEHLTRSFFAVHVRDDVSASRTAYRSDRKRAFVRRRRTYRTRIGVGNEVGVALFPAETRRITVARGGYKAYTAFVDTVVNGVDVFFIGIFIAFSRKAAGRTERHVYRVYVEQNSVLESEKYVFRLTARA